MSLTGIKKDIELLKKKTVFEDKPGLREERFWKDINKERVSEGKRPVVFMWNNFQNIMIDEIFYEPNLEKIDEYRIQEGKFPLLPLYLAGEYEKVKDELRKYDNYFFYKIPRSTLLKEMCQPTADKYGFDDIDGYHEAQRLFMQDQKLYHLHHKDELYIEFEKYLVSEWEKEGALLKIDDKGVTINQTPIENNRTEPKMIVPDEIRKYLELITSVSGEYRFTVSVQRMKIFEFVDSVAVPGQIITLKYTPTSEYKGEWSAEFSHTGKILPISNIKLWVWNHQRDINRRVREITTENN
jgi:hypothetical protein